MAIKVKIYNQAGEIVGEQELSESIFNVKVNIPLLHQAVVAQTANRRQVLAHTKDRSEVRGGGSKPWRQKGTGRARAGSSRSPLWIGGGVIFGPTKDRNFTKKINRKMKQAAIRMALSDRTQEDRLAVIDKIEATEFRTKTIDDWLRRLETKIFNRVGAVKTKKDKKSSPKNRRSILIINDTMDEKLACSARNLVGVKLINLENINILDLLRFKNLIIPAPAIRKLEAIYN